GFFLLAIAGWWLVFGNLSGPAREESAPPVAGNAEMRVAAERDWISIFAPEDSTNVALSGNATAELMAEEGRAFLRLKSEGATQAEFQIGRGILEQMAGRKVLISILAGSSGDD